MHTSGNVGKSGLPMVNIDQDGDAHAQPCSGDPNEMCDSTNLYQVPDGQGVVSPAAYFSGRPLSKRDPQLQRSSISFDSHGSATSH
ncbi:hypothetical protein CEXT_11451 [Caerostris extrusa]|uniref:Uncharacterized protein n=1 Tax=Caerostris extrusa TaxID=172846 RepID=A0AAV4XNS2_CAEEX|nr:hypothetical protein CEXT_11451 [Caerostris extrusa]